MFTESSANYYNTATLVSNCVDISGLTNPAVNFEYNMYGLSMGDLLVEVIDASGTATQVFYVFGEQGFDWNFASRDLSAWAGATNLTIQISSTTGGSFTSDCAIDAVCVEELVVTGCTDAGACNYDASASVDDGSCEYLSCCTDNDRWSTSFVYPERGQSTHSGRGPSGASHRTCLLYTSPRPRDATLSRMPSSA